VVFNDTPEDQTAASNFPRAIFRATDLYGKPRNIAGPRERGPDHRAVQNRVDPTA